MANFIESIKLRSILPNRLSANFIRDDIADIDVDVSLSIKADLSDKETYGEGKPVKLIFTASVKGTTSEEKKEVVSLIFSVEYVFELLDIVLFSSHSDEERIKLCTSMTYLDFRAKLGTALVSIGMSKLKLPPNMIDLAGE